MRLVSLAKTARGASHRSDLPHDPPTPEGSSLGVAPTPNRTEAAPTRKRLRLLLVEDSPDDAERVLRELRQGGYQLFSERVATADALQRSLQQEWDLVIADHSLPQLSSFEVLTILRRTQPNLPLIIVTSEASQERAVAVMKLGAYDCLPKENLGRLAVSARNALHVAEERRRRKRAEQALWDRHELFRVLSDSSPIGFLLTDLQGRCLYTNPRFRDLFGYFPKGTPAEQWMLSVHPDDRDRTLPEWHGAFQEGREATWEIRLRAAPGSVRVRLCRLQSLRGDAKWHLISAEDITERRHLRQQLQEAIGRKGSGQPPNTALHDLNNLLCAVLGFGELVLTQLRPGDPFHAHVTQMAEGAKRAAALIRELMCSARQTAPELRPARPVEPMDPAGRMLQSRAPSATPTDAPSATPTDYAPGSRRAADSV